MGRRGPPRAPSAVKLARGETRPSRLNFAQPRPLARLPRLPDNMSPRSVAVWRRVLRDMAHTGAILAADTDVLRAYCEAVALYEQSVVLLFGSGPVVKGSRGNEVVRNPLQQVVRDHRDAMLRLAGALGLTPAARAGMQIDAGPGVVPDVDAILGVPPRLAVVGGRGDG